MRKSSLLLVGALLFASLSISAQVTEGVIEYTRTVKFKFNGPPQFQPPGSGGEQVKTQQLELLFSGKQSLLRNIQEPSEQPEEDGPVVIRMVGLGTEQTEVFTDYNTSKRSSLRELGGKEYVVDDTLIHENWKLTSETKTIIGYTCRKATTERIIWRKQMMLVDNEPKLDSVLDTIPIVAWYADGFSLNAGPEASGALTGMIMEYDFDNGKIHIVATSFSPKVKKKEIISPKGKHITADEFKKLEAEFRQKMRQQYGGPPPPRH